MNVPGSRYEINQRKYNVEQHLCRSSCQKDIVRVKNRNLCKKETGKSHSLIGRFSPNGSDASFMKPLIQGWPKVSENNHLDLPILVSVTISRWLLSGTGHLSYSVRLLSSSLVLFSAIVW